MDFQSALLLVPNELTNFLPKVCAGSRKLSNQWLCVIKRKLQLQSVIQMPHKLFEQNIVLVVLRKRN